MKTKLLGCIAATAMAATVVVATPAMAFHGGVSGGRMFTGRHNLRFHNFAFRHHRFGNFAFFGAPFAFGAATYENGCWRQVWTPYGWQWSNICYDYGDSYGY
jgi:hypothetical protein